MPGLTRFRGGAAALLAIALSVSGALIAAPAASAEELSPTTETTVTEPTPGTETPAPGTEAPAPTGEGTPTASPAVTSTETDPAPVTEPAAPAAPTVQIVENVSNLDPTKEHVVTVRGTGFVANPPATSGTRPPLSGQFGGAYVVFGSFLETWKPSAGAPSSSRSVIQQKWALPESSKAIAGASWVDLKADGSFETTLTLKVDEAKALVNGRYGVYTYPGSGATYALFETYTPVAFAAAVEPEPAPEPEPETQPEPDPAPASPVEVRLAKTTAGQSFEFDVTASGILDGSDRVYVGFFEKPAVGADYLKMDADAPVVSGSTRTTLVVNAALLDRTKTYEVVVWKTHTTLASGEYGRADVTITTAQWDELFSAPVTTTPGTTPSSPLPTPIASAPAPTTATQSAGSLTWGISTSFANYVTGNVAKGTISTSGVGGGVGGYTFPQAAGGSWNAQTQTGAIPFSGVVTFTGHDGALSRTISNPVITVTSATSATISAGDFSASLNLGAASKRVGPNGEITWSGVPVNGGFGYGSYNLAADPLTFTVGAPSAASFGSTRITAQANVVRTAAATPPATQGIRVLTSPDQLVAGGEIEFEAAGFRPNERGILVVMYSEPRVLDTGAGADENGVVRWIGTLPDDLTGTHTITLQGSISVGMVITIAEAAATGDVLALRTATAEADDTEVRAAGLLGEAGGAPWALWAGAIALVALAGAMSTLVVMQRRRALATTQARAEIPPDTP